MNSPAPLCLVTGAGGYVGGRLVPALVEAGYRVRVLARHPERLRDAYWLPSVELAVGDARDRVALSAALEGVETAYYLLHSLQEGSDLEKAEEDAAQCFATEAAGQGVARIIYLGGLAPELPTEQMSAHMRSRVRVGEVLRSTGVDVVELRAAIIIGSGSASFEMLRYLTERLPAMVTPRWVRTRTQPIAIRDVLKYLVGCARLPAGTSRSFDIGGPDVMSYEEMMQGYAAAAGLRPRIILPVNVLTPGLSGHWVNVVTPVPRAIARPLIESLRHEAVCHENDIAAYVPIDDLVPFPEAVRLALTKVREADVATRWSNASVPGAPSQPLPSDPQWSGGTLYEDVRQTTSRASIAEVWAVIDGIGGANGWYSSGLLWKVRGQIDRMLGGVGLRRGRRDPRQLAIGDVVDFWRVEEREPPRLLRLRAEMKNPGRAWLEFRLAEVPEGTTIRQRAVFAPRGLAGHAYWWSVAPFHAFVFPTMIRKISEQAQAPRGSSGRIGS